MKNRSFGASAFLCIAALLAMAGCKSNKETASGSPASSANANTHAEAINYQILLGNDKIADKFGGLIGLPTSFLYSRDGKKVKTVMGLINHDDLSKALEAQLAIPADASDATPAASELGLQIPTLDGSTATISQYKGKVVLVNFWATWCQPCRIEIPWLIEFNKKYGPQGLVILGVAMDDDGKKAVEPWVKAHQFDVEANLEPLNRPAVSGN
jgi:thiol-disulfide isomerase/thioredoxin